MNKKIVEEIKKTITKELAASKDSEEVVGKVKKQIDELSGALDKLTEKVETLSGEKEQLSATISELEELKETQETDIKDLKGKLEESTKKVDKISTEKASISEELAAIKAEVTKKDRIADLEEGGLLFSDEDLLKVQEEKATSLSDEDFESYKKELAGYKKAFSKEVAAETGDGEGNADEGAVPPANVNSGNDGGFVPNVSDEGVPGNKEEASKTERFKKAADILTKLMTKEDK